jgi:hypothetical protein
MQVGVFSLHSTWPLHVGRHTDISYILQGYRAFHTAAYTAHSMQCALCPACWLPCCDCERCCCTVMLASPAFMQSDRSALRSGGPALLLLLLTDAVAG